MLAFHARQCVSTPISRNQRKQVYGSRLIIDSLSMTRRSKATNGVLDLRIRVGCFGSRETPR